MTAIKLDSKLANHAADAIEPLTARLYARPGMRIVGVVELAHVERTQPAPDADKEASVKLQIKHLEIANADQEDHVREAQRALYLQRTAQGALTDDGEVELSRQTIENTGGLLHAVEVARLRVVVRHWAEYARRVQHDGKLTTSQLQNELSTISKGLFAALRAEDDGQDD